MADRRFTFHAATADQPENDLDRAEVSGPIESSTVTLTAAPAAAPSAATQLAALLRDGVAAGEPPAVLVARSA